MAVCSSCGQSNPSRARFCMSCATPLPREAPAPHGARKTVTVLFCDVAGSTPLAERLDPEAVREVLVRFFGLMRAELERHGGTVEKFIGDAVMAVFGIPLLHEDDALRAVRAASAMQEVLEGLNEELAARFGASLRTRIGVNTGEVVVGDPTAGEALVVGDAVNLAARLEQAASPGEVLLGPATYALVRDHVRADPAGPLELKGKSEAVHAYRLRSIEAGPDAIGRRAEPPLVGRREELRLVRTAFERSAAARACSLLTIVGSAGVGKSRLAREFEAAVEREALVLRARCLPYGEGITFWPVAELVKAACGITDDEAREHARSKVTTALAGADDADLVAERIGALIGVATVEVGLQETYWAIRRFLEWLGRELPLVVVFDDIQWAEPAFLDLIEYLAGWTTETGVLLLCLARPDLLDARPSWGAGTPGSVTLPLAPLGEDETARFVEALLGPGSLDEATMARISEAAGGNPLFLEEMLRMLEDDGLLRREGDRWAVAGDLGAVPVPGSIQALLGARLDRLGEEERAVIRCAAVVGKVFWWGAVVELAREDLRPRVGTHLQTLVRKELIRPERSSLAGEDAFRFHHILIQEAAYRATPKDDRAGLHERFAAWTERTAGERVGELEEVIGYHLEQAVRLRADLGAPGERERALSVRAGQRLASAGARAVERRDLYAAVDLLGRAADLLPEGTPGRLPAMLSLGEVLGEMGEFDRAGGLFASAEREARAAGDAAAEANAAILRLFLLESTDPKRLAWDAAREAGELIERLEGLGDHAGLAKAWRLMGDLHTTHSRFGAADEAYARSIEHARTAGARRDEADALGRYTGTGSFGPAPIEEVERRCAELRALTSGTSFEAPALRALAGVRAMQGRFDEGRELAARARRILEDAGLRLRASWVSATLGEIELLAGDPVAAEAAFREGFDAAVSFGEQGFQATVAAQLAHALVEQGRGEEAQELTRLSEELAAEDDLASQVLWRTARARAVASAGGLEDALALAREAVALAETTDDVNMLADALVDLAGVLSAGGEQAGSRAARERAVEAYRAKGNLAAIARAEVGARLPSADPG